MRAGSQGRRAAIGFGLAGLVVACAAPAVTPPPPVLGIDWARSGAVERPADFDFETQEPASSGSGLSGHPYHFPGQVMLADVARLADGSFAAVGYVYPGWHPGAWTSPDGRAWSARPMGNVEFTFPVAMAVGGSTVVAVGRSGGAPMAWTSADGRAWTPHEVATLGGGSAERMTAVVATQDGFLAGGSVGPELAERHARFWRSADGATWRPVADEPEAFANAEVRSIVQTDVGFVAVGIVGTAQEATGSVAWLSADGERWTRVDDPDLEKGRAVAVVEAPAGGLVAVGSDFGEYGAYAWVSVDGRTWQLAPDEASRHYAGGKMRMTDVTVAAGELVAVGNYVGMQYGTAVSWVSTDGLHWQQSASAPDQQGGEFYAVIPGGPGLIAVGSYGAPDNYIPTVWLSPAREPAPSRSP